MKIVITGGHHNAALAVVSELKKRGRHQFLWLGHKYSMWGDEHESAEYQEVAKAGLPFVDLKAGKFYHTYNPLKLLRLPYGFIQAFYCLWRFRPDLILSFGGYLAVPVVVTGWLLRIPAVTHEQTTVAGLANQALRRFVRRIFITWPQSKKFFPVSKVVLTGLPLRKAIFQVKKKPFLLNNERPTIYVTGGKQGAHIINENIKNILPQILLRVNLIHQTGHSMLTHDFETLSSLREDLAPALKDHYFIKPYFFEDEIGFIFQSSDLIVSRAGAHIIYELAALQKPALLIPIPWVSHNEQYKNARILVNLGMARLLPEDQLTPEALLKEISHILDHLDEYNERASKAQNLIKFDAAETMVAEIISFQKRA